MSKQAHTEYVFREELPVRPVELGTNILVTGSAIDGTRGFLMRLLAGGPTEGMVFLSTDRTGREVVESYEQWAGQYDPDRMAVVDCNEESTLSEEYNVCGVANPSDLTGIGMRFSGLYEELYANGCERIRTGFATLSPLVMYAEDLRLIYRFLHTLTGRVTTTDGLGLFALDPETVEKKTLHSISQPFDGRIDLRAADGENNYQARIQGLPDQPEGWQSFTLSSQ